VETPPLTALNFFQLRTLVTVTDCEGFTRAAIRLNFTWPAVSAQV
jgi:DNA-binding transcriptional LysR family regulator